MTTFGLLKKWGRDYRNTVHPYNPGGGYVNFMSDDEVEGTPT